MKNNLIAVETEKFRVELVDMLYAEKTFDFFVYRAQTEEEMAKDPDPTNWIECFDTQHQFPTTLPVNVSTPVAFQAATKVLVALESNGSLETMKDLSQMNPKWFNE